MLLQLIPEIIRRVQRVSMADRQSKHSNGAMIPQLLGTAGGGGGGEGSSEWEGREMREGCLISNTDLYNRSYYLGKVLNVNYFYKGNCGK